MFSEYQRHDELAGGIALGAIDGDLEFAGLELRLRCLLRKRWHRSSTEEG